MTYNLYTELALPNGGQANGTWSKISGPGPAAPAAYNDDVDFTGTSNGITIYRYTVGTSSADYSVNWVNTTRNNDTCATALGIGVPTPPPFSNNITNLTTGSRCTGKATAAPTDSGEPIPASWGAGPLTGDVWHILVLPEHTDSYNVSITVDGGIYGGNGLENPCIQIFSGATSDTCGTKTLEYSSSPGSNQIVDFTYHVPQNTSKLLWIRLASYEAGQYNIYYTAL